MYRTCRVSGRSRFSFAVVAVLLAGPACGDDAAPDASAEAASSSRSGERVSAPEGSASESIPVLRSDPTGAPGADSSGPEGTWAPEFCTVDDVAALWPLVDTVATTPGEPVLANGVWTATLDASAGGFANQNENPFVYIDLAAGEVLPISDLDALQDRRWHIALKRVLFRVNGGDSGPGNVRMTRIVGASLEDVQGVAEDAFWATDRHFDAGCVPGTDPIGNPYTAMNALNLDNPTGTQSWYERADSASFAPVPDVVYVVEARDGSRHALQIDAWQSGVYTLRWRAL